MIHELNILYDQVNDELIVRCCTHGINAKRISIVPWSKSEMANYLLSCKDEEHELHIWYDKFVNKLYVTCTTHHIDVTYITNRSWNRFKEGNFLLECLL